MERRIIIALLCLLIAIILPLTKINNLWQHGGADPASATASAPASATVPASASAMASATASAPASATASAPASKVDQSLPWGTKLESPIPSPPGSESKYKFEFNGKQYTIVIPDMSSRTDITINSRLVNPYLHTYRDNPSITNHIVSLRGRRFNIVDALTYLVMFPDNSLIARIRSYNVPELNRALDAILAFSNNKMRRNFKIMTPTPTDTVVLNINAALDSKSNWLPKLYAAKQGEPVAQNSTWIDTRDYDQQGQSRSNFLASQQNLIIGKEKGYTYNCSTIEGAKAFLTDLAYYPALTGCHYESYGNKNQMY